MRNEEEKYRQMTETPVRRLISVLAVPTMLSMLVTALYNMADTFFIGKIRGTVEEITSATGACAVVFSLMAIIQAIGFFFGQGSGTYISRELGNKDEEAASKMATFGFVSSVLFGILLMTVCLIFITPLAYALGSTDTILPYAKDYMRYVLIGAPFMCGSLVLNNQMRYQGNAFISMIGIISGAVINVGLDALFVMVLGMGTGGAGLATAIGQAMSFCVLFIGMRLGNNVKIRILRYRFSLRLLKELAVGGAPSLARQGLSSIATLAINFAAKGIGGDVAISAMGIASRVMNFCYSAVLGFGQGFQPVCGYNYGAKKYSRVREGYFFCLEVAAAVVLVVTAVIFIFSKQIVYIFNKDASVISTGSKALRAQCVAFQLVAMITYTNMMLQTMGKFVPATLLAVARQGLFFIPMVFVLPPLFGETGLILVQPVADVLAFILALFLGIREVKRLKREEREEEEKASADKLA